MFFSDERCTRVSSPIEHATPEFPRLYCSGYESQTSGFPEGCDRAFDGLTVFPGTSVPTFWSPQCPRGGGGAGCAPGEAWIGAKFLASQDVRCATAANLGMGTDVDGRFWKGGLSLQRSFDGITWSTLYTTVTSNTVRVPITVSPTTRSPTTRSPTRAPT
eukprot:3482797-Pyramimonas_sp.AAC.1